MLPPVDITPVSVVLLTTTFVLGEVVISANVVVCGTVVLLTTSFVLDEVVLPDTVVVFGASVVTLVGALVVVVTAVIGLLKVFRNMILLRENLAQNLSPYRHFCS